MCTENAVATQLQCNPSFSPHTVPKFVNLITADVHYVIKWLGPPDLLNKENEKKKDLPETFGNYKDMESLQNYFVDKNL